MNITIFAIAYRYASFQNMVCEQFNKINKEEKLMRTFYMSSMICVVMS